MSTQVEALTRPRLEATAAIQAAAGVVSAAQITELVLTAASFALKPLSGGEGNPVDVRVKTQCSRHGAFLLSRVEFHLDGVGPRSDQETIEIVGAYSVTYKLSAELEADALACFGAINGVFNVWPYWREFVSSASTRLGLPPLALPLLTPIRAAIYAGFARPKKRST